MWRNTGLPVRLFVLDARACLPIICFLAYWSWLTAYIAIAGTMFFAAISFAGLTVPALFRVLRRMLVGSVRPAVPAWNRRRLA